MNRQQKTRPEDALRPILRSEDVQRLAQEFGQLIGQYVAKDEASCPPHRSESNSARRSLVVR